MVTGATIHDRVATGILEAAAGLLANGSEPPSMAEVAEAAGVGRATLYRYFPTRDALVTALVDSAIRSMQRLVTAADLDSVPVPEALARLNRAFVTVGSQYAMLAGQATQVGSKEDIEDRLGAPVRRLMQRGLDDGTFRADLTLDELLAVFAGLMHTAVRLGSQDGVGVEKAAALVTSVLLQGAARRTP